MSGEVKFNGPPPQSRRGPHGKSGAMRVAMDARPGEWAQFECESQTQAGSMQAYLKKVGYEASRRGKTVYARKAGQG